MRSRPVAVLLALAAACALLPGSGAAWAQADIYRCTGEDGVPLFTNIPNDRRCQVVIKGPKDAGTSPVANLVLDRGARRIPRAARSRYEDQVLAASREHDVEAALIHAVISAESGYNPLARSVKGAKGLMQLIPETGARYGATNLLDPKQNIDAGTRYLKDLIAMFGNDLRLAIAAYNAGEGAVMKYGTIPPYAETRLYVPKVLAYYKRYRDAAAATNARIQRTTRPG
ncbi:MAG: transglycosylase SLT domain-containing protein [Betaproteobacteria bacterium]|nr:transglycosylase SLT domain-containing protein [Betaproteobacteria bacterium]